MHSIGQRIVARLKLWRMAVVQELAAAPVQHVPLACRLGAVPCTCGGGANNKNKNIHETLIALLL